MDESDMDARVEEFVNSFSTLLIAHNLLIPIDNEVLLINKLQGLVTNIKWSPKDAVHLFNALLQRFESTKSNDSTNLLSWMLEMLHYIEINYINPSWTYQIGETLIKLIQDKSVTDQKLKEYLSKDREKNLDEILDEIRQQTLNQVDENLLKEVKDIVSSVNGDLTSNNNGSQRCGFKKDLLKFCRAVKKTHTQKITPRLTQMVSWCIMALSEKGWLIQVGTGEGKSCIVAMFAAFRAMKGESVDIITSSSVLAERDMKEWQDFYKELKISVSCNTNKQDKDKLKECYKCKVVYGTADEFSGHWLLHHFERMDIFGQRTFQCAIVDEVDSLMLDKGHHVVYLSSDMPALQHLSRLLTFIWVTANQYSRIGTETIVGRKYPFHHVIVENITRSYVDKFTILQMAEDTGTLAKGSVKDLRRNLSLLPEKTANITANQLAAFFKTIERGFPSCQFVLYCINNEGTVEELNKGQQTMAESQRVPLLLTRGGFCQYMYTDKDSVLRAAEEEIKHALHFTPCDMSQDKGHCYIPGFLSDLVKSKLKVWIENAFYAQTMTMDHEYIKDMHGLVPVDYSCTGVVENFMKWTDGLHQFLEMKHMFKLSDMNAITNYMSNVGLLQKYGDQIFGISGTLGQQAETETLQKIYKDIKTCQIPSFKRRKLFEVEGVFADDEKEWIEKICKAVITQTNSTIYRAQRAVLVICETISRAKVLYHVLGDMVPNKELYISNNMDNTAIFAKKLEAGEVIIATNLAGRGTDLQVSEQVKTAGGLFVVQTFLPKNARVEAQAFGRTARQGAPGSAQLIVCSSHLPEPLQLLVLTNGLLSLLKNLTNLTPLHKDCFVRQLKLYQKSHSDEQTKAMSSTLSHTLTENSKSGITTVKKIRDDSVAKGLTSYLECDIPKIKKKEELFSQYLAVVDEVYKNSDNKPADSYLSALNEFWGMWLLIDFKENDSTMENKLAEDLETAREKIERRESPSSNLHHYIAFGNELREKGHLAESIKMYTKAIQEDPCWAAIAYYNRACTSLIQQDGDQDPSRINQALEDLQNALKSVELYCEQIEATHRNARQQVEALLSDAITRFDSHMMARRKVLLLFKANINEAIKKVDRARDIGGNVKVTEILVYFLLPLEHFLPVAIVSTRSLGLIRSRDPLMMHQLINHPYFDIINEIRCLNSLGLTHVYSLDTRFSLGGFFSKAARRARKFLD